MEKIKYSEEIKLSNVRIHFERLLKAGLSKKEQEENKSPYYTVTFSWDKESTDTTKAIEDAVTKVAPESELNAKGLLKASVEIFQDGDKSKEDLEEYSNRHYMHSRSSENIPPLVVDQSNTPLTVEDSDKLFSGVYANVVVQFYFNNYGKVSKLIKAVQIVNNDESVRIGEKFVSTPKSSSSPFENLTVNSLSQSKTEVKTNNEVKETSDITAEEDDGDLPF